MDGIVQTAWRKRGGAVKWPNLADERVALRPAAPRDAEAWVALRAAAAPWQSPLESVAVARAMLAEMAATPNVAPGWRQFMIEAEGAIVGDLGICWPANAEGPAEIGFELAPAARGAGLATRAVTCARRWLLDEAGLRAVAAIVNRANLPAIAVVERAGFRAVDDAALAAHFALAAAERLHLAEGPPDA